MFTDLAELASHLLHADGPDVVGTPGQREHRAERFVGMVTQRNQVLAVRPVLRLEPIANRSLVSAGERDDGLNSAVAWLYSR